MFARLIARSHNADYILSLQDTDPSIRPEMPPKADVIKADVIVVDEEEAEPLKNDVFGSVVQTIKGKLLPGGIRNSITIYENGALITSMTTFKGCCGPRGCLNYYATCCPALNETRMMIAFPSTASWVPTSKSRCVVVAAAGAASQR